MIVPDVSLEAGLLRLLEQCERENQNAPERRFLYTVEILSLLGIPTAGPVRTRVNEATREVDDGRP